MTTNNKGAYHQKLENRIHSSLLINHRMYSGPLDDTSVWNTFEELKTYIEMPGTYAYPGQIVTVANGTVEKSNGQKDYDTYIIRSDMSLQKVSGSKRYENMEAANSALQNLSIGDVVLVWDNDNKRHDQYSVDGTTSDDKKLNKLSFNATTDIQEVSWDNLTGKPKSDVTDIDDAVTLSKKFNELSDGSNTLSYSGEEIAYKKDIPEKYDVNKLQGIIKVENLPRGAFDILHPVETEEELKNLTNDQVQTGDTIFINDSKKMYFVKDESKLGNPDEYMDAFQEYSAGTASRVNWDGVQNKPTSLEGYGITDAVKSSDVSDTVVAGKVIKANQSGKIEGDITGDAGTIGGKRLDELVQKSDVITRDQLPSDVSGDCIKVENKEARLKLVNTATDAGEDGVQPKVVHKGFLVLQEDSEEVFCVIDDTKLNSDEGYQKISTSAISWEKISGKPNSSIQQIDDAVTKSNHENRDTLDMFTTSGEHQDQKKRPKFNSEDMAF